MSNREIIENALKFLCNEYNFSYEYYTPNGNADYCKYSNQYGKFTYYEWMEFGEREFSVIYNQQFRKININEEYPKMVSEFHHSHKGIKWFFKDKRKDYWEMIANIIKNEITATGTLFGIKIIN